MGKDILSFPKPNMLWRILKNKKGFGEIIAFVLVFSILLLPALNTFHIWQRLIQYDKLRQVGRTALLRMEIEGGLTPGNVSEVLSELEAKGFDRVKISFDYTPAPVAYGDNVWVSIRYPYKSVTYTLTLGGLQRNEMEYEMVYGPVSSTSKKYFR